MILSTDSGRAKRSQVPRSPKTTESPLGQRVRDARLAKGWTQGDLARIAGVTQSNVSNVEQGKPNVKSGTLLSLERALGLWPGELMAILSDDLVVASRESFIERYSTLLSQDDITDLRRVSWFGPGELPPDDAWMGVVHARRAVRARGKETNKP